MCSEGFFSCLYSPEDSNSLTCQARWDAIDLLPAIFLSETDYPMSKEIIPAHLKPKFKATSMLKSHSSDPCMNNISQSTSSSLCASHFRIRTQKEEEKNSATLVKTFCKGFLFVYNFRWGKKNHINLNEVIPLILGREILFTTKILHKYASIRCGEASGNNMEKTHVRGSAMHINFP